MTVSLFLLYYFLKNRHICKRQRQFAAPPSISAIFKNTWIRRQFNNLCNRPISITWQPRLLEVSRPISFVDCFCIHCNRKALYSIIFYYYYYIIFYLSYSAICAKAKAISAWLLLQIHSIIFNYLVFICFKLRITTFS